MKNNRIVIVYCSHFGSTAEISKTISEELIKSGISADLVNHKHLKKEQWPNIQNYHGIIIGSGLKFGKWTKEVNNFVKKICKYLQVSILLKGFFVTSGYASDPTKYEEIKYLYIEKQLQKFGVTFDLFDAFGGVFDLTDSSILTWLDKKIVKSLAKTDERIDIKGKNDFRDWQKIIKFAKLFTINS